MPPGKRAAKYGRRLGFAAVTLAGMIAIVIAGFLLLFVILVLIVAHFVPHGIE